MRLLGFLGLVFVTYLLLRQVPVLGNSFIALWVAVILVSVVGSRVGDRLLVQRKLRGEIASLEHVDSPHNRGKLGSLHLSLGNARTALPHLEAAWAGENETLEWGYRLGCAQLKGGAVDEAVTTLREVTARDEEYAYGAAQLRLAEALAARARREAASSGADAWEATLAALDVFDRNHGQSPESAYRRGRVLRALGRKEEAGRAFARVGELARTAARYQRREAAAWAAKAAVARVL